MNNRVTVWLEDDDLNSIDTYIRTSQELKSRSEFVRMACAEYIKNKARGKFEESEEIVLNLSDTLMGPIDFLVLKRYYPDREAVCERLIRMGLESLELRKMRENLGTMEEMALEVDNVKRYSQDIVRRYNRK